MQKHETPEQRDERVAAAVALSGIPSAMRTVPTADDAARVKAEAIRRLGPAATLDATERWIAHHTAVAENARANMETPGLAPELVAAAARDLVLALVDLGRFVEARTVAADHAPEHAELVERADEACGLADDDECDCPDRVLDVGHPTDPNLVKRKKVTRHAIVGQTFNPYAGTLVHVVACSKCRHVNARPELPALLAHAASRASEHPDESEGSDFDALLDAD